MLVNQIRGKKFKVIKSRFDKVYKRIKLYWIIIFVLALIFMCFGFIYDIAIIIKAQIGTFIHPLFYFIICLAYAILSFFDYIFNEKFINLILEDMKIILYYNSERKNIEKSDRNVIWYWIRQIKKWFKIGICSIIIILILKI